MMKPHQKEHASRLKSLILLSESVVAEGQRAVGLQQPIQVQAEPI